MAEVASTQASTTAQAHSETTGPGEQTGEETTVDLFAGDTSSAQTHVQTENQFTSSDGSLEELRRQNERLHANVQGWQEQSRRNLEERNALAERIARLEGSLQGAQGAVRETQGTQNAAQGQGSGRKVALKAALNKWVNNDESGIDEIEQLLSQQPANGAVNAQEVESVVTRHLQLMMSTGQALAWVGQRHPEMRNVQDPIYADIFANYEAYARDPGYAMLFPDDARFHAAIPSPDGLQSKNMDVRVVNDLAARLKLARGSQSSTQRGREEEYRAQNLVGNVAGSTGAPSRTTSERAVEAWDLLSPKERDEIRNMMQSRAVPQGWPKTERGIAKKVYELATPQEKQTMRETYHRSARGVN